MRQKFKLNRYSGIEIKREYARENDTWHLNEKKNWKEYLAKK